MTTSGAPLQRQYNGLIKNLEKNEASRLSRQERKLSLLQEEMGLLTAKNWDAVIEKKVRQLTIVDTRFQEYRRQGLMKSLKPGRKMTEQPHPKVVKNYKYQTRITADLDNLRRQHYDFYKQQLAKRISRCQEKITLLQAHQPSLEFQLETLPLLATLVSKTATAATVPWCLTAPSILALPASAAPPFHLLDQPQRTFLKPAQPLPKPVAVTGTFSFATRKATSSAVVLLKTDDMAAQLRHIQLLVPPSPADHCKECKRATEWIKDEKEGFAICSQCSFARSIAANCKESSYGTDIDFVEPFHYEKKGHFIACLRQRQAKQDSSLPPSVLAAVRAEILRLQMLDPVLLRPKHTRKILKRLGLSNYYDDDVLIWSLITGTKPPQFTEPQEVQLICMFDQSLKSYLKHKGVRNNYLTYSFAIHKFLEILDWPREIREFYPVLKSDSKRDAQEVIFHNMARDVEWPIIKTQQQFIDEAKFTF